MVVAAVLMAAVVVAFVLLVLSAVFKPVFVYAQVSLRTHLVLYRTSFHLTSTSCLVGSLPCIRFRRKPIDRHVP